MLSFFRKYPYTNFEQLNIDWLLNMVGGFDARITSAENKVTELNTRVEVVEGDVTDLKGRMTTAEGDIDDLQDRMITAEVEIDDLQDRMTTAEGEIDDLQDDVNDLQDRMTTAEGEIDAIGTQVDGIPIITANPVGTPIGNLTTLGIGDGIYNISSGGGGGGSGTEVIANPSGTAADDLNKIYIDGIIYDIPVTPAATVDTSLNPNSNNAIANAPVATAINSINSNISGLQSDISSVQSDVSGAQGDISNINDLISYLNQGVNSDTFTATNMSTNAGSGWNFNFEQLPAGTYFVSYMFAFDVTSSTITGNTDDYIQSIAVPLNTSSSNPVGQYEIREITRIRHSQSVSQTRTVAVSGILTTSGNGQRYASFNFSNIGNAQTCTFNVTARRLAIKLR